MVWLVAAVTAANGVLSVLQVYLLRFPRQPHGLFFALPLGLHHWGRLLTIGFGLALIYLSLRLLQRKRVAWILTVAAASGSVAVHLLHDDVWYTAVAPTLTLVLLLIERRHFTVRSELTTVAQGVALVAVAAAIAVGYGFVGLLLLDERDFGREFTVHDAFVRSVRQFVLIGNDDLLPRTRFAYWFLDSLDVVGVGAALVAAYSLFRPIAYRIRTLPHERAEVLALLRQYGGTALDEFKLWPDKAYFFNRTRTACIAYHVAWDNAVSLGDPVGDPAALPAVVAEFARFCADNGWGVVFHQVSPMLLPLYREQGFDAIKIGEEAVVDLARFAAVTAETKDFRYIRRRLPQGGHTFERRLPPHDEPLLDAVEAVSRDWLTLPGRRERSFTMGAWDRAYIARSPLDLVRDAGGEVIAFANEVPSYRAGEATIDLMRHRVSAPNGTMDFLLTEILLALAAAGYARFDLGLAPLAGVGDEPDAPLQEQALHELYERLNRFFAYKGLHHYKSKFDPVWEDRSVVYRGGPPGLVRAAVAIARVTEG